MEPRTPMKKKDTSAVLPLASPGKAAPSIVSRLRASDEWNKYGAGLPGWPLLYRVNETTLVLRQLIRNWDLGATGAQPRYKIPALGQLFGSGKTTLARNFFETLRTPEFERVKNDLLVPKVETDQQLYKAYASKVDDFIKNGIIVEVRRAVTWEDLSLSFKAASPVPLKSSVLGELLFEAVGAIHKPVLFFFDDVPGDESLLDRLCSNIEMVYSSVRSMGAAQPFFGFLLAGRELGALHLPRDTSARLEWVLLQGHSLEEAKLVSSELASGKCRSFARMGEFVTADTLDDFARRLHEASGGIALLAFQVALGVYYSWENEVSKRTAPDLEFLFDSCFAALQSIRGKDSYFDIPSLEDAPGLSAVFFLAVTQQPFLLEEMVPVLGSREKTLRVSALLRQLPVTVARHASPSGTDGEKFVVVMSGFQKRFLLSRQRIDVRMALMAPVAQCVNAPKLAERIVVSTILTKCIACKEATWGAVLPALGRTKAGGRRVPATVVGRVCPRFQDNAKYGKEEYEGKKHICPLVEELLSLPTFKSSDIGWFFEQMKEGYYIFRDESHSADALACVGREGEQTLFVQLQVKEGEQEFSLTTLKDELGKTYTGSDAVLVVFSRSVGANLGSLCKRQGALVLGPGQYYFHTSRDSLVALSGGRLRVVTPDGEWQGEKAARSSRATVSFRGADYALANDDCKKVVGRLEEGLQLQAEDGKQQQISSFVIPGSLEVVVLHPESYESFLGKQVFDDIPKIARGGSDDVDLLALLACPVAGVCPGPQQPFFRGAEVSGRPEKRARNAEDEGTPFPTGALDFGPAPAARAAPRHPLFADPETKIDLGWLQAVSKEFFPGKSLEKLQLWLQKLVDNEVEDVGTLAKQKQEALERCGLPIAIAGILAEQAALCLSKGSV